MAAGLGRNELNVADVIRFDVLPDDVLLDVFDFYSNPWDSRTPYSKEAIEKWQTLIHVCRRWRSLVFQSSRRLNLQLVCTHKTPAGDTLDVWPALPLIVKSEVARTSGMDNIIVALGHNNRVCEVLLWDLADWQLGQVSATMQVPFPELKFLELSSYDETTPVIPDTFLGGSAPHMLHFILDSISFPGLPKLLLSATHLVELWLTNIPPSGYISPEAMVTLLSASSSLEALCLQFESPQSHPDRETRRLYPLKLSVLPAIRQFTFKCVTEYLEDVVSRIDTPRLDSLKIEFFDQVDFDFPRLIQFINRAVTHRKHDKASAQFDDWAAGVLFGTFRIFITCASQPERRLSFVVKLFSSSIPSTVENLYIERRLSYPDWKDDAIEDTLWLQLLLPFTGVKNLYLSKEFSPGIAGALQGLVGDKIVGVLPSLQKIFVELKSFEKKIGQFVVARRLSGHPVAISYWDKD